MSAEQIRLEEAREQNIPWKKWGPYLSERQWGTVREDYSEGGDAWNFFTHDQARSRAYRWGEDGLAGISDDKQRLCFALALWNGRDPILKERLFGLTNSEGNHGEDVKEYYFYLDSTPTHSYMKYLYKYPQAAFPYADLVDTNKQRSRDEMEYELLDTGVFDGDRYFDVFVEYAKAGPEDILVRITAANRGPDAAELHLLPTLWFRNDWATWIAESNRAAEKPNLKQIEAAAGTSAVAATHPLLGEFILSCEGEVPLLFTENETNNARLFPDYPNDSPYVKDGINNCVVEGNQGAVNPGKQGTKVAAHYRLKVAPGESATVRLRLTSVAPAGESRKSKVAASPFGPEFDKTLAARLQEADEFYRSVTPPSVSPDAANVMRQAIAGMLWSKQFFFFDGDNWLDEHHSNPLHAGYRSSRNSEWFHMLNEDIISMPDKWEYPWYAAWDLAFHTLPLSIVDPDFAKEQMELMLKGRLPAPQRADARLRVELQRREPPGPRLRDALPAPHRAGPARRDGRGFSQVGVQQAPAELHLVGEPQGPLRQERLRGGLPRPRQHRRLRPQRPAAHRRPPRAGGRHGLDGPFQPEHAGTRSRDRRPRPHLRGHDPKVRGAHLLYRPGHEPARSGGHVGRGGRLLLRRAAAPRRQRHSGSRYAPWWGCCPCAPRR